jgi:hypothetical protein
MATGLDGADVTRGLHDSLRKKKAGRQLAVFPRRPHDYGKRLSVEPDLERFFHGGAAHAWADEAPVLAGLAVDAATPLRSRPQHRVSLGADLCRAAPPGARAPQFMSEERPRPERRQFHSVRGSWELWSGGEGTTDGRFWGAHGSTVTAAAQIGCLRVAERVCAAFLRRSLSVSQCGNWSIRRSAYLPGITCRPGCLRINLAPGFAIVLRRPTAKRENRPFSATFHYAAPQNYW